MVTSPMKKESEYSSKASVEKKVWHLASYPRSGNHLVRALLEYATKSPTFGCPGAKHDTPIYSRKPNIASGVIKISEHCPVGLKSHFLNQLRRNEREHKVANILLITRDPVGAISSQICRQFSKKIYVSERAIRRAVEVGLDTYLSLLYAYRTYPIERRYHIKFEDLMDNDTALYSANELLAVVCPTATQISLSEWNSIRKLAKESQVSLVRKAQPLRKRVSVVVDKYISYDDVQFFLDTGQWQ